MLASGSHQLVVRHWLSPTENQVLEHQRSRLVAQIAWHSPYAESLKPEPSHRARTGRVGGIRMLNILIFGASVVARTSGRWA